MKYTLELNKEMQSDLDQILKLYGSETEAILEGALALGLRQAVDNAKLRLAFDTEPGAIGIQKLIEDTHGQS